MVRNSRLKLPDGITDIGRPSKFTPERCSAIVDAISHRIPYEYAAEANGICEATLHDWLKTAKAHRLQGLDTEYTQFSEAIKRAEMTRMREHSDMIAAKPERWQADAWLLERRWPKHYGANAQLNELSQRLARFDQEENKSEPEEAEQDC